MFKEPGEGSPKKSAEKIDRAAASSRSTIEENELSVNLSDQICFLRQTRARPAMAPHLVPDPEPGPGPVFVRDRWMAQSKQQDNLVTEKGTTG